MSDVVQKVRVLAIMDATAALFCASADPSRHSCGLWPVVVVYEAQECGSV
jgi:hypothetical protein